MKQCLLHIYIYMYVCIYMGFCPEISCLFVVGGVRIGFNISERLKTYDMRTFRTILYFSHILKMCWLLLLVQFCRFYTPLDIEDNTVYFRHLVLYFYWKDKKKCKHYVQRDQSRLLNSPYSPDNAISDL